MARPSCLWKEERGSWAVPEGCHPWGKDTLPSMWEGHSACPATVELRDCAVTSKGLGKAVPEGGRGRTGAAPHQQEREKV